MSLREELSEAYQQKKEREEKQKTEAEEQLRLKRQKEIAAAQQREKEAYEKEWVRARQTVDTLRDILLKLVNEDKHNYRKGVVFETRRVESTYYPKERGFFNRLFSGLPKLPENSVPIYSGYEQFVIPDFVQYVLDACHRSGIEVSLKFTPGGISSTGTGGQGNSVSTYEYPPSLKVEVKL